MKYYNQIKETFSLIRETNKIIVFISFFEMFKYIFTDFTLKYGLKNLIFDYFDTFQNVIIINNSNLTK
jgi:hypothetical protein